LSDTGYHIFQQHLSESDIVLVQKIRRRIVCFLLKHTTAAGFLIGRFFYYAKANHISRLNTPISPGVSLSFFIPNEISVDILLYLVYYGRHQVVFCNHKVQEDIMKEALSRQEWVLMEALWLKEPLFLSQIMDTTANAVDWNKSSYLTYLRRMADKGLIGFTNISGNRCYCTLVKREDCIDSESSSILSKLTEDSKRLLLASMIKKSGLTELDRDELLSLIEKLGDEKEES
jgi:BlaI family penicillinase repressor